MNPTNPPFNFWEQMWQFLFKYGAWIGWVCIGLVGMFSADLLRNKKFTMWYIAGCTGAAIFVGYVGGSYVLSVYPDKAPVYIPVITLLSNNLISALAAIDYKALMQKDYKGAFELLFRNKIK